MASSQTSRLGTSPEEGVKAPCVVATQSPITLEGGQIIETITVIAGDRVLVRAQADPTENGIYNVAGGVWVRSTDWNQANDVVNGVMVVDASTTSVYQAVFTGEYEADITSVAFDLSIFTPGNLTSVTEVFTLANGQLVVNFTNTTVTYASFFISGDDVDSGRLTLTDDYTYVQATGVVTLVQSYPAGAKITALVEGV